jgi:hypothetical protein
LAREEQRCDELKHDTDSLGALFACDSPSCLRINRAAAERLVVAFCSALKREQGSRTPNGTQEHRLKAYATWLAEAYATSGGSPLVHLEITFGVWPDARDWGKVWASGSGTNIFKLSLCLVLRGWP